MNNIGILFGGNSPEHEVSIKSADEVFKNLDREKFNPHKFFINKDGRFEFELGSLKKMDVIFIVMHGIGGEDGSIQGFLQTLGVRFTGPSVYSSAIGMDKYLCRKIWSDAGLSIVPQRIIASIQDAVGESYPFILKPRSSGSSVGVSIVKNAKDLEQAFNEIKNQKQEVLLEKYIKGKELTVGVLNTGRGLEALPIVQIIPFTEFYDYEAKYNRDDTQYIVPARLDDNLTNKIHSMATKAAGLIGITNFSRVDFLLDENDDPYILEINTIPGLTSHSLLPKAALSKGISFKDLLSLMIKYS